MGTGIISFCRTVLASLLLVLATSSAVAQPGVYRWVDENGVVHFSDSPPDESSGIVAETIDVPDATISFRTIPPVTDQPPESESTANSAISVAPRSESTVWTLHPSDECWAESPLVRSGEDLYAPYEEPELLNRADIELFTGVIRRMRGRWSGPDTGFVCDEFADGQPKQPRNRRITAEGDYNPPESFVLDSTISAQGSNHRETLRFDIRRGVFRVNSGNATLIDVTERSLEFGYRLQMAGVATEFYWHIELVDTRAMRLRQWTYAQGRLNSASTWQLTKPQ